MSMRTMLRQLFSASVLLAALALVGCGEGEAECPEQNAICGGVCTPVLSDSNNCGGCGDSCSTGFECVEGACIRPDCAAGTELCGTECVDLQADRNNCGVCGEACGMGDSCEEGVCSPVVCEEGTELCGNDCADLETDRKNCGSCGTTCGSNEACELGACVEIPCEGEGCEEAATTVFAACFNAGTVSSFDTATLTSSGPKASGIDGPQAIALLGDDHLVAAGGLDQTLYVFERETMTKVGSTTVGASSNLILVREQTAWVVNSLQNTIQVIDVSNPAAPKTIDEVSTGTSTNPWIGEFDSNDVMWVSLWNTGELLPIDFSGAEGKAGAPILLPAAEGTPFPSGVTVLDGVVYVTLNNLGEDWEPAGNGRLATLDVTTRETGLIDLGEACLNPGAVKPMGSLLAVTCTGSYTSGSQPGAVVVVDPSSGTVTNHFPTGGNPMNLAIDRVAGKIYAGDAASVEFIVIDMSSGTMERVAACAEMAWEYVSDVILGW